MRIGRYPYCTPIVASPCRAVYVSLESVLGIEEGVPWRRSRVAGPYRWHPVGTGRAGKESIVARRPSRPGLVGLAFLRPGRITRRRAPTSSWSAALPRQARYLGKQGTIMHIIRRYRSAGTWTGETSRVGAAGRLPVDAAGRRGIDRRSSS